jgi:FkbM family methyltransferase
MAMTAALEYRNGWLWPAADNISFEVIGREAAQLPEILDYVPLTRRRVAVQAGGNCGLMVRPLAHAFETVYTFEPHPVNFSCLVHNLHDNTNVIKMQACVGSKRSPPCDLAGWPHGVQSGNTSAVYVRGDDAGTVPVLAIDCLHLRACDLLMLDVEGYEHFALEGAFETVRDHRPVIVLELIGHGKRYGSHMAETKAMLDSWGYRPVARLERDTVFVYGGQS